MRYISEGGSAAPGVMRSGGPIPALDGIRGLAVVWVVLHNASDLPTAPSRGISHLFVWLTHPGWIGVQLFFALSGFLITAGLLEAQGAQNYFRSFYARRALRILPLYYGVLLLVLVVLPHLATLAAPFTTSGQAPLWLFTANMAEVPYGFGHFWSLSVEEQFYLFWPLVVFQLPARRLLGVCLWIAAGALLLRGALAAHGTSWWTLYSFTPCRMDALALGGAGACALRLPAVSGWLRSHARALGAGTLAVFLLGIPLTHAYDRGALSVETLGYTVLAGCSAAAVTLTALAQDAPAWWSPMTILRAAVLRSCGRYSYAMYVFHGLLHKLIGEPWLHRHYGPEPAVAIVCCYSLSVLALAYVLGLASYHLYEKRFLRMKRWFVPRSTQMAR